MTKQKAVSILWRYSYEHLYNTLAEYADRKDDERGGYLYSADEFEALYILCFKGRDKVDRQHLQQFYCLLYMAYCKADVNYKWAELRKLMTKTKAQIEKFQIQV
jgi:NAD-specific glutamate dehydrogenase